MRRSVDNQRGMALIITLMVVAMLTIIVTEFSFSTQVDMHMVHNSLSGLQASQLARSGINMGEAFLLHDIDEKVDAFTEEWCPLPGPQGQSCLIDETNSGIVLPPNMRLRVQIMDEGAKFSVNLTKPMTLSHYRGYLNQLRTGVAQNPQNMPVFVQRQLLLGEIIQGFGAPPDAIEALGSYWTKLYDQLNAQVGGGPIPGAPGVAGTPSPGAATPLPTPVGNQQYIVPDFPTLDDVGVIPGFTPDLLRRIRPLVTAYDTRRVRVAAGATTSPININTVSRRLLEMLLVDSGVVDSIISEREQGPIRDPNRLIQPAAAQFAQDPARRSVRDLFASPTSNLFLIRASAVINSNPITGKGGIGRTASVVVRRDLKPGVGPNPPPGVSRWVLTRVEWHKEGGAALFRDDVDQDLLGTEGSPSK